MTQAQGVQGATAPALPPTPHDRESWRVWQRWWVDRRHDARWVLISKMPLQTSKGSTYARGAGRRERRFAKQCRKPGFRRALGVEIESETL